MKIDEIMSKYPVTKIFLATEDQGILNNFISRYGSGMLFYVDQERIILNSDNVIADTYRNTGIDIKQNGMDYVTAMYLLSKCNFFLGGITSATRYISLMRDDEFEYEYIWNLGFY